MSHTDHQQVHLIGAALGRGAPDSRCALGPEALRAYGIRNDANQGPEFVWDAILKQDEGVDAHEAIAALCTALAERTADLVAAGERFAVVGGDHSCAIGTWSGAAKALGSQGHLGLLWIDAHMDSHTPETSPSGAIHGMPVAALLGHGLPALTRIATAEPKVQPQRLALVGIRSYEGGEAALLERLGVRVFFMEEIQRRGLDAVMAEALAIVSGDTAGFGISIDLDALRPEDAPGVGTPEPGGLAARDLLQSLEGVGGRRGLLGVEVTELNPARDEEQRTLAVTGRLIQTLSRQPA